MEANITRHELPNTLLNVSSSTGEPAIAVNCCASKSTPNTNKEAPNPAQTMRAVFFFHKSQREYL